MGCKQGEKLSKVVAQLVLPKEDAFGDARRGGVHLCHLLLLCVPLLQTANWATHDEAFLYCFIHSTVVGLTVEPGLSVNLVVGWGFCYGAASQEGWCKENNVERKEDGCCGMQAGKFAGEAVISHCTWGKYFTLADDLVEQLLFVWPENSAALCLYLLNQWLPASPIAITLKADMTV